jgi:cell division protein FtsW
MIDKPLLFAIVALLLTSMVMSYSLSAYVVLSYDYAPYHFVLRQGVAVVIGLMLILFFSKLNPEKFFVPMGMFLFLSFALLMTLMQFLSPTFVHAVGGAKRWIQLGPVSLAPVEFFKVGFVFFLAWSFSRKFSHKQNLNFLEEIRAFSPYLFIFLFAVVLIAILQKDLGQIMILGVTLLILFLLIGSSLRFFFFLISGAFGVLILLILIAPHRLARIKSWWGMVQDTILSIVPFEAMQQLRIEAVKEPYQISNSLNAIYHGGYTGQGLGSGQFKLGYLAEVHSDFVLAGIAEELGFIGVVLVTLLTLFIVYRIFYLAAKMRETSYYLFSVGIGLLIMFAFLLNAYGISGITPVKGIAVPFLSYGGSHIVASSLAIGMVLMISKTLKPNKYHTKNR